MTVLSGTREPAPSGISNATASAIRNLRKYAGVEYAKLPQTRMEEASPEYCELCSLALPPTHRHLLEMQERRVACSCDACGLRFQNVVEGRFKLIPRDSYRMESFHWDDGMWENLALPINLAFFYFNTRLAKTVAMYPSPAGATESLLPLESWNRIVDCNPCLSGMEGDVQALLVNRVGENDHSFLAPMDRCYELVGLIRIHWRGLAGGDEVWNRIERFFADMQEDARPFHHDARTARQPEP